MMKRESGDDDMCLKFFLLEGQEILSLGQLVYPMESCFKEENKKEKEGGNRRPHPPKLVTVRSMAVVRGRRNKIEKWGEQTRIGQRDGGSRQEIGQRNGGSRQEIGAQAARKQVTRKETLF